MTSKPFIFLAPESGCLEFESVSEPHEYWERNFVGKPMTETWEPPKLRKHGSAGPEQNFAMWMPGVPVVSAEGADALRDLLNGAAECLPLIEVDGRQFYALNVFCVAGLLDHQKSDLEDDRFVFLQVTRFPADIFKIPENRSVVFVTQTFVNSVHDRGVGRLLLSPAEEGFRSRIARSLRAG